MSYLGVFSFVLNVVWLFWMISYWVLFESTMNWFFDGEIIERKSGFLDATGKLVLQWWGKFTGSIWNNHHYYQYVRSLKFDGTWWKKLLVLWVVSWIMGSLWILYFMNSQSVEKRREKLASMCDERARMLQDQFNVSISHIHALAILISTFHHGKNSSAIDQKTFAWYTERTAFERPLIRGVAYAQRVLHSEREKFEKQQGWTIKRMDALEQPPVREDDYSVESQEPSSVQEEYAPVIFAQDTISHVVSLDMMSGMEDRKNILRARALGRGVLTAPFRLLKSKRLGVILTFAVYNSKFPSNATPTERIQATDGYLGGVFDIESLVDKLLHQLASKQTILVNVYDTTDSLDPISMYGSNDTYDVMFHVSTLDFGDPSRKHEMHCRFKQRPPLPWLEIATAFGVLVIALLLGHIFHATMNRIAKVEEDYRNMMELKKRAEAADVAKSQFLATVSHEIRTPMNGVLGMLQMLMDTNLDMAQQDYVRTAQASGKALVSLMNEVLDQAKIEAGKFELESIQFDLRAVLDDVLSLFSEKSQKGFELAVYVSDQVPEILTGDPGRFRQIITNLVGNSIKFTERGHIFVTVHLVEEVASTLEVEIEVASTKNGFENSYRTLSGFPVADKRRSWENFKAFNLEKPQFHPTYPSNSSNLLNLLVSVEDTGIGIPHEAQSRVFTPFMQVGSSISRIHGGTGIGLSISKCLVERMKGEIGFVSDPQTGSTFTFTACFTKNHHQKIYNQSNSVSPELQGLMALVVDQQSVRARVTKYHLERLGVQVEISSDINHSLSKITRGVKVVDMVLVDKEAWLKNPNLSFSLANNWTKNGRSDLPKLFLLVNSISSVEVNASTSMGFFPIRKPLRASMLAAFLQGAMGFGNQGNFRNRDNPFASLKNLLYGKNILVVDDNSVNLRVAAGALKKYGAQVTCADSGKKALLMLKPPHNFDACFMDIQMPEMDGFEATRRIRDMEWKFNEEASQEACGSVFQWHVPILAMTADVIQATHEECTRCGMDGYVSKPFEAEQLCREVERFFKSTTAEMLKKPQE